jgi:hypothetical protein
MSETDTNASAELPDVQLKHQADLTPPAEQPMQLPLPKVLDLSCGVINRLILQAPKDKAKSLFKRLKGGEKISLGEITLGEKIKIKLNLKLDHSAYIGPGFNNDVFRASVDQLVKKIAPRLRAQQDLNIRTSDQGMVLFDIPAGVKVKGQLNVMMLVMELFKTGEITVVLSYFEPTQFTIKE